MLIIYASSYMKINKLEYIYKCILYFIFAPDNSYLSERSEDKFILKDIRIFLSKL